MKVSGLNSLNSQNNLASNVCFCYKIGSGWAKFREMYCCYLTSLDLFSCVKNTKLFSKKKNFLHHYKEHFRGFLNFLPDPSKASEYVLEILQHWEWGWEKQSPFFKFTILDKPWGWIEFTYYYLCWTYAKYIIFQFLYRLPIGFVFLLHVL